MGIDLQPLEFTDCVTDSPYFRKNLHEHEKELEKTSQFIKRLIKELKELLNAAKNLSRAQRTLSTSLQNFTLECIGATMTDDEVLISRSLGEFGKLISMIEDERDRMMDRSYELLILPLESFRKEHIGGVKEGKKKFEKQTAKFCQSQERYLNLSTKKQDTYLQEADATLEVEQENFIKVSLEYVFLLQEVQERKKFEFVEPLLSFIFGWLTFYHQGHEVGQDFKPYMSELQFRIQKTRENFIATTESLMKNMKKTLESRPKKVIGGVSRTNANLREGYLFLMEKKAFGTTWTKQYCVYQKDKKEFSMMSYNQLTGKFNAADKMTLASCVRRMSESIEKRFCFDVTSVDKPGVYTFQALSEEDRKQWMDIMDGKEPMYSVPAPLKTLRSDEKNLDDVGFNFLIKCIDVLEKRGLEEQGLYRVVGVSSKVNKLLMMGLDRRKCDKLLLDDPCEWESKTITSALKTYLRNLPEPLMTYKYHNSFIAAAKQETHIQRLNDILALVYKLPQQNFKMLERLMRHLTNVVAHSDKNLMTVSNLGVCFGPTLLRPEEETVAAIMDIKFCNVVVEISIENYSQIFRCKLDINDRATETSTVLSSPVPRQKTYSPSNSSGVKHAVIKSYAGPVPVSYVSAVHGIATPNVLTNQHIPREHYQSVQSNRSSSTVPPGGFSSNVPTDLSESYLHSGGYLIHPPVSIHSSPQDTKNLHHLAVINSDPLNSVSSSDESVSSVSSQTLNSQKTKRLRHKKKNMNPTNYRLQDTRRVRTLYACTGDNDGELSFEPNEIISDVRSSLEPGWLEGTLNGKTGLIPENYVEFLS